MNGTIEIPFDDSPVSEPPQAREQPSSRPRESHHSPPQEEPITRHFAPQIERSFTSLLWHAPQYLDMARSQLDFELHISIRAYRKILEAITIVYGDLGIDLDFPCVAKCVAELDAFDECGGLQGLDQVFTDADHYPEGRSRPEPVIREYIRMLKEYAVARKTDPYQVVRRYTCGRGYLQRNKLATKPTHPSVIGKIQRCCCGQRCTIAGWPGEDGNLNLTLTPER
jgi:hypothetical protein